MAKQIFTYRLSEPLEGVKSAVVDINTFDGNLKIDPASGGQELVSGDLQYLDPQYPPTRSFNLEGSRASLTIQSSKKPQPWLRLPWATCNGATEWQVHLHPALPIELKAHSGGGNVRLDLTGMVVTQLTADTGGGNMEVTLPSTPDLKVAVKSGAGNVTIHLPHGTAARIKATTGLGKVMIAPRFAQVEKEVYQSPDFDTAVEKVEILASSGAGNVSIE